MSTTITDVLELPLEERLKCMEALWDSISGENPDSPEWHGEVLAERKRQIDDGTASVISGDELKRRLRSGK